MRPDLVEQFLKSSLKKLCVDYVDLYLTHWPIGLVYVSEEELIPMTDGKILYDKTTDIEAVWKAMEAQVDAGRAKSIGISNYNPKQIERTMKVARIPPANHQVITSSNSIISMRCLIFLTCHHTHHYHFFDNCYRSD
jgi:alcohol dehydrogenase (NADP+)